LTFCLANEVYGLEILKVQEIISMMNVTRVPRAPEFVTGVINLRGKVIPVISMRLKFGFEKIENTDRTCIIVAQVNYSGTIITLGIIVDEVSEVLDIKENQICGAPAMGAAVNTDFIMGMGKVENHVVMLLDLDQAFSTEELGAMAPEEALF